MKLWILTALAIATSVSAQDTSYRDGDRMAGRIVTSPQGQAIAPKVVQADATGTPVPAGTAADPLFVNSGGGGDVQGTGTLALATTNATYSFPLSGGRNAVGLTISGLTGSGATITVERSNDGGTTWTNANTTESSATSSLSSTITANGQARVGVAGATNLRLRVSIVGTGTASVAYNATTAAGPVFLTSVLPQVNGSIGGVSGDVAAGVADAGNPVKIGGTVARGLPTAMPDGTRTPAWVGAYGNQIVGGIGKTATNAQSNVLTYLPDTYGQAQLLGVGNYLQNGTSWDMAPGTSAGAFVISKGSASLATGQVSVGTTATLVAAARAGRSRLVITQSAAGPCYYGPANTLTATSGSARIVAAGGSKVYLTAAALYGICPGGAVTTDVDEEY